MLRFGVIIGMDLCNPAIATHSSRKTPGYPNRCTLPIELIPAGQMTSFSESLKAFFS